jgi:hypothetical protein
MDPLDRDIKRSDPVLGRYFNFIAVDQRLRVRLIAYITWLVVLPLLLFAIFCDIAHKETRFDLGSLDRPVSAGSHDLVVGLSFLGDTMVWPFFLLIPLLLVMLRMAIGATVTLCRESARLVRPEIIIDPTLRANFRSLVRQTEATLCYRGAAWRSCWAAALIAGLLFFAYNTLACIRGDAWPNAWLPYDQVWSWLKPYALHEAVIKPNAVVITLNDPASFITPCSDPGKDVCLPPALSKLTIDRDRRRLTWSGTLSLEERRALAALWPSAEWQQAVQSLSTQKQAGFVSDARRLLEKWDTDLRAAPLSWAAARIWVLLIGYALLPLAVLRVANLLIAVQRFARQLARADMLRANPYSSESRESLDLIIQPLFAANYCLLVVSVMVALAFVKIGAKPEWYDLALVAFVPAFAFGAIAPLLLISDTFERGFKVRYLSVHAAALGEMHRQFHDTTATMTAVARGQQADALTKYSDYLARGEDTAIFPVSAATVTRMAAPVAPLALTLIEKAIGAFF